MTLRFMSYEITSSSLLFGLYLTHILPVGSYRHGLTILRLMTYDLRLTTLQLYDVTFSSQFNHILSAGSIDRVLLPSGRGSLPRSSAFTWRQA